MQFRKITNNLYLLEVPFCGIWTGVCLHIGKKITLIDSGPDSERVDACILPALSALGIGIGDVGLLLNTHTHGDHIGGHFRLKELNPDLQVVSTALGAEKLRDPLRYNIEIRQKFPQDSPAPSYGLKGVETDLILKDGESIDGLMLIETSGHDNDSVCFFETESGTLVTGDSLQQNGTDTQGMALYMYLDDYVNSIRKLQTLDLKKIVCGHPFNPLGAIADGESACREYLKECLALVGKYDDFIRSFYSRRQEIHACARALIRTLHGKEPEHLFLALYTVSEHLKHIQK